MRVATFAVRCAAVLVLTAAAQAGEWTGQFAVEGRLFPQAALGPEQERANISFSFQPEYYSESKDGGQSFTFTPFFRLDHNDPDRTHLDIRELTWQKNANDWELRVGIRRVFWGVTESQHLVDVINQTDFVENLDGEDKLGQPMVNFAWIQDWGTLDFFILPGFRDRTFPSAQGRPSFGVPVDFDNPQFESGRGRGHVDWAARWSHTLGLWDVGLSHFAGTSRDPDFVREFRANGEAVFVPRYDQIHQSGLDLQMTQGGWLWKAEVISRSGQRKQFFASTAGFEYTIGNLKNSGTDIGLLLEYSYDERGDLALTPLEDDIFFGVRFALNDVQSSEVLAGAAVDRETGATFVNVEASRRFGQGWTLDLQYRGFVDVPQADRFLFGLRNDDYLQAEWAWHF
jgi:hypothetical protein